MTTHVWLCADSSYYQQIDIDDNLAEYHELMSHTLNSVQEYFQERVPSNHTHIFGERPSPKGNNIFHECPGKKGLEDIVSVFLELGVKK